MVQVFSKHDDAIWQATTIITVFFNPLANKLLMTLKTILATKQSRALQDGRKF